MDQIDFGMTGLPLIPGNALFQDVGGTGAVQVRVSLRYTDATMGHFSFVPGVGTSDWELLSHDFSAAKDYDWGMVRLIFSKPDGTLWYDEMSLMR